MVRQDTTRTGENGAVSDRAGAWLWLSIAAALLAVAGSVIALAVDSIYAGLTPSFLPQALAQDIANLAVASPALLILAALALRSSLRAYLLWLGVLTFTLYNYVIYAFSIPFGPLFPLWVAVLGLCIYALIGGVAAVDHGAVAARFASRRAVTVVAWFLIVPAVLATGVLLLKRTPLAHTLAPSLIVFLVLTGVPILLTPAVQAVRGETAAWGVVIPIGTLTVISLGMLVWLLSTMRSPESPNAAPEVGD